MATSCSIPTELNLVIEPSAVVPISTVFSVRGLNVDAVQSHKIKFIIGVGNVFHPEVRIVLDASHLSPPMLPELAFRLGENNLFEECSTLVFILNHSYTSIMGSYNLISSRSYLETSRVGNGNIFQPSCHIQIPAIKNGNIFAPLCLLSLQGEESTVHEMVFYMIKKNSADSTSCHFREHMHGTRKNVAEVGLILNVVKKVIQANHHILAITNEIK